MDINEIKEILPHRYPFLLIDKVISMEGNKIVAIKNVTVNENYFQGHFPAEAVMPGVLIIEALAQTGAVAILSKNEFTRSSGLSLADTIMIGTRLSPRILAHRLRPSVPGIMISSMIRSGQRSLNA